MRYIIGMILSIVILIITILQTGVSAAIFISGISLLVVLGGTITASTTSFSIQEVMNIFSVFKIIARVENKREGIDVINEML